MCADIGIIGMGVMGSSLALNIEKNGFTVSVFNGEHALFKREHT